MSRTVPGAVTTNTAKKITAPTWLVQVRFGALAGSWINFSSGATISHQGYNFNRKGLEVHEANEKTASFTVQNDDNAITAMVSVYGANDNLVKIWKYYETDGVLMFDGYLDGHLAEKRKITFAALRYPAGMSTFPGEIYTRKDFPNLPKAGSKIKWNTLILTLSPGRQ